MSLDRKKLLRTEIMKWVYEETNSDESVFVDLNNYPNSSDYELQELWAAVKYLEGEYLLKPLWTGSGNLPQTQIAHRGVTEVELAMENKGEPTQHFVALDTINIVNVSGDFSANQFQQSGSYASQTNEISGPEGETLKLLLEAIRHNLDQFSLNKEQQINLEAEMTIASAEISKTNPRRNFLRDCLVTIEGVLTSVLTEVALHEILTVVWPHL